MKGKRLLMTDPSGKNDSECQQSSLQQGLDVIHRELLTMPLLPGVYRMLTVKGEVIYVGKAKALKKRVRAYTRVTSLPQRLRRMVAAIASIEIVTTPTEAEALLLEANLIKRFKPRYNILLRDDKSYPWLVITASHPFPMIKKHRGKPPKGASYWGPFASVSAVNQTIEVLERIFLLRTCSDNVFSSRTRPCLLYQIKRCSAPCVSRITTNEYHHLIGQAKAFLNGRTTMVQKMLVRDMEKASQRLDFERATLIRDRISALARVQASSIVNPSVIGNGDVIAISEVAGQFSIQIFFVRGGHNNGGRVFFPDHKTENSSTDVLAAFLTQFYEDKQAPAQIFVNKIPAGMPLICEALTLNSNHTVRLFVPMRGKKRVVVEHAEANAREALERRLAEHTHQEKLLQGVQELFNLSTPLRRIEIYDNSHIMGTYAYGVMVVAGPEGFLRSAYRKFAIKHIKCTGDDFGMMREVMIRRFNSVRGANGFLKESADWPDIILIDGGAGQYSAVRAVLDELGIVGIKVVAIAKGINRNSSREWFHTDDRAPFQLPSRDPVLFYLQRLRDEAHRFAITTHRMSRGRNMLRSELDQIPMIGPTRKKALLNHFGSVSDVRAAAVTDLENVTGISKEIARLIYGYFHPDWRKESRE